MKIVAALCFLMSAPIYAGTAVIINANNNSGIDIDTVKKIYLGKVKAFPDGSRAIPLTFEQGNNIRDAFNNNVLGKSESQYSAFWSKLVFTGRGTPPEMRATEDEMAAIESAMRQLKHSIQPEQVQLQCNELSSLIENTLWLQQGLLSKIFELLRRIIVYFNPSLRSRMFFADPSYVRCPKQLKDIGRLSPPQNSASGGG